MDQEFQQIVVVAGIAVHNGKVLIARRKEGTHAGVWEFPGGKVEPGESYSQALQRELMEELNEEVDVGAPAGVGHIIESGRWLYIVGLYIRFHKMPTASKDHDAFEWVNVEDLPKFKLGPADYELAIQALSNKQEVSRLDLGSFARFSIAFYFLFGLVTTAIMLMVSAVAPNSGLLPEEFSKAAAFFMPVSYAMAGGIAALVGVFLYNLIARFVGGLEFSIERK